MPLTTKPTKSVAKAPVIAKPQDIPTQAQAPAIPPGFVKPMLSKDVALKMAIYGPPGAGKSYFMYGMPASKHAPIYVVRTKPLDNTASLFKDRIEDGEIYVYNCFDTEADPDELTNLYGQPGTEALTAQLKAELEQLRAEYAVTD